MKLKDMGEARLVAQMRELLNKQDKTILGIGDDSAVVDFAGKKLVLTSDMIQDKTHIYKGMSYYQAGRKVVVSNYSDLASMGARPRGFLFSLGISPNEELNCFKEVFRGVDSVCSDYGTEVLGGDLNESPRLILSGFAFGDCEYEVMKRHGATPGQAIVVTGSLGNAAAGWRILEKSLDLAVLPNDVRESIGHKFVRACLEPQALVKEGVALAESGLVTSCTDITDGLLVSLKYMRNNYGFRVEEPLVPVEDEMGILCDNFKLDRDKLVYMIGEDFQLLFTTDEENIPELEKKTGRKLYKIGQVIDEPLVEIRRKDGKLLKVNPQGYDHFRQ